MVFLHNDITFFRVFQKPNTLLSLMSAPIKDVEIILDSVERHLKDNATIKHSPHEFTKGKSSLTNFISLYDTVDYGKAVDVMSFNRTFGTVPDSNLLDKSSNCEMNWSMMCWVRNWLNSRAQSGYGYIWLSTSQEQCCSWLSVLFNILIK